MKHSAVVLAARPVLIPFSPGKTAIPRRLRITVWQAHSWTKEIIMLRKRSDTREKTQTARRSSNQ